ncbi:MAG: ATP-dependent helicase [Proteobacteria bacterium]|nr:ATP-dependent helicase [Pseudomonadota bacterium]
MNEASLASSDHSPAFGAGLNEPQRLAATWGTPSATGPQSGPLLIIAGAGTGKTNTLAHRVAWLLLSGVRPERMSLMTFSRRAAQEMLRRAERITTEAMAAKGHSMSSAARHMWSGTFHSIANRLLREFARSLQLDPAFSVIDRGDSGDLIDLARQDLGLAKKSKRFPRKDTCLGIYSHRVNTGKTLSDTLEQVYPWCGEWEAELNALFRRYVEIKQAQELLDYDDLLLYWHALMQEPSLAAEIGSRFDHVLVDEYQDTNVLQADILMALKPEGDGLCVVGDDAQSIYSFRAASVENILTFPERFSPAAQTITLEQNYRSVQPILDAANALIAESQRQYQKHLHATKQSGQKPRYVSVEDTVDQSLYIVEQILAQREAGTLLRDQAVLMRKAHDSDALELELVRRNIPYVKYGGLKFLEAAHVKDVLALLRFADNPKNRLAGFRTLQLLPGIGPATAEQCLQTFEADGFRPAALGSFAAPAAAAQDWPEFTGLYAALHASTAWAGQMTRVRAWYEPHLERLHGAAHVRAGDIEQLEAMATRFGSREQFLTELTLDPPQASGDEAGPPLRDEDYLILSTVHSAKGQEWDNVFVLNVTDGTFPSEFATDDAAAIEEERRLLYVAMTRARNDLHLMAPLKHYVTQQRRYGGKHIYGARSRFMTDGLMATFDEVSWPNNSTEPGSIAEPPANVDVGRRMRSMWD